MKRLTERDANGHWKIRGFTEILPAHWQACNRLAAYEGAGLESEEVPTGLELANVYFAMLKLKQYEALGTVEHLSELVKAEQKGQEGCEWCHGFCLYVTGDPHGDYRLCPMCGRDLRGESHDRD